MDVAALLRATADAENVRVNDRGTTGGLTLGESNTDVWAAIRELQAAAAEHEKMARGRRKLTWNRDEEQAVSKTNAIGEWNPNLQGYTFNLKQVYHIQNRQIVDAAGQRVALEDIDSEPNTWTDRRGFHKTLSDREFMARKLLAHLKECAIVDSMLCSLCFDFTAKNAQDQMKHMYRAHPVEFAELVQEEEGPPPVEMGPGPFTCCGKTYETRKGIDTHRRVAKAHSGETLVVA
jgi:hypothetical protein